MSLASILDACLTDIQTGAATLEECLARYPEQADDLRPLLEMALLLEGIELPKPVPEFQARLRQQLMQQPVPAPQPWSAHAGRFVTWWARTAAFIWAPRLAAAAVAFLLFALVLTIPSFAEAIRPDTPLYPLKRTGETVRLAVTFDSQARRELHGLFSVIRREEAEYMLSRGDIQKAQELLQQSLDETKKAQPDGAIQINVSDPTPTAGLPLRTLKPMPTAVVEGLRPSPTHASPPSVSSSSEQASHGASMAPTLPPTAAPTVAATPTAQPAVAQPTPTAVRTTGGFEGPTSSFALPTATNAVVVASPTARLPLPTATAALNPPAAYPSPSSGSEPSPTAPPTNTPQIRRQQPTPVPLVSATPTHGGSVQEVGGAISTPLPTARPTTTPFVQQQPTPIPLATTAKPTATPTARPALASPSPVATHVTIVPSGLTSPPPAPPTGTAVPTIRPNDSPTHASQPADGSTVVRRPDTGVTPKP